MATDFQTRFPRVDMKEKFSTVPIDVETVEKLPLDEIAKRSNKEVFNLHEVTIMEFDNEDGNGKDEVITCLVSDSKGKYYYIYSGIAMSNQLTRNGDLTISEINKELSKSPVSFVVQKIPGKRYYVFG